MWTLLLACADPVAPVVQPPPPAAPPVAETGPRVLFLGDGLTAGPGVAPDDTFPAQTQRALDAQGLPIRVVNGGLIGDTSAGGLGRSMWLQAQHPDIVVLALGGEDAARGLSVQATQDNLRALIKQTRMAGVDMVLLGMPVDPGLTDADAAAYAAIYPTLATEYQLPLVPAFLDALVTDPTLGTSGAPTPAGHLAIAERLVPVLSPVVKAHSP